MTISIARRIMVAFIITILSFSKVSALEIKGITSKEFSKLIEAKEELKLFFFFTSWCSVCKSSFNKVLSIISKHQKDNRLKVFLVSLDDNIDRLDKFSANYDYQATINYFDSSKKDMAMSLYSNGINYKGSIPHITLFYQGKIIADDNYEITAVGRFIENLLATTPHDQNKKL